MYKHIRDLEVFVDERGTANSQPILFIHGFPFDHSMWRHQMDALAAQYHCIAPDLRGHGGTTSNGTQASPAEITVDVLATDLIALLNELLPTQPRLTICGLSLGGYIAFALWRVIPHRIQRLILADTKATADSAEARARRMAQAEKVQAGGAKAISDGMLDSLLAPHNRFTTIGMEVRRMIESTTSSGIVDTLHALASRPDSTETLTGITVPTLVMVGEMDKLTPLSDAQYMHERLPVPVPLSVIPAAGHISPLENPTPFNDALQDFLERD